MVGGLRQVSGPWDDPRFRTWMQVQELVLDLNLLSSKRHRSFALFKGLFQDLHAYKLHRKRTSNANEIQAYNQLDASKHPSSPNWYSLYACERAVLVKPVTLNPPLQSRQSSLKKNRSSKGHVADSSHLFIGQHSSSATSAGIGKISTDKRHGGHETIVTPGTAGVLPEVFHLTENDKQKGSCLGDSIKMITEFQVPQKSKVVARGVSSNDRNRNGKTDTTSSTRHPKTVSVPPMVPVNTPDIEPASMKHTPIFSVNTSESLLAAKKVTAAVSENIVGPAVARKKAPPTVPEAISAASKVTQITGQTITCWEGTRIIGKDLPSYFYGDLITSTAEECSGHVFQGVAQENIVNWKRTRIPAKASAAKKRKRLKK